MSIWNFIFSNELLVDVFHNKRILSQQFRRYFNFNLSYKISIRRTRMMLLFKKRCEYFIAIHAIYYRKLNFVCVYSCIQKLVIESEKLKLISTCMQNVYDQCVQSMNNAYDQRIILGSSSHRLILHGTNVLHK